MHIFIDKYVSSLCVYKWTQDLKNKYNLKPESMFNIFNEIIIY